MKTPTAVFNENSWMTKLLYKPLFNVLMLLYVYIPGHDFGVAIIVLTLIIRLIMLPSQINLVRSQYLLKKLQPKIDAIREQHKDDQTRQSQELMKVYQEHKVNPFSSCLPLIIQLPILYALYRVFTVGLTADSLTHLYAWFPNVPTAINTTFLAFTGIKSLMIDLTKPSIFLAIFAGVSQLAQSWLMMKSQPPTGGGTAKLINAQMMYMFPVMTTFIAWSVPAALALYWAATTIFGVAQQLYVISPWGKRVIEKEII